MTTTPLQRLRAATDPWAITETPLPRADAERLENAIHARLNGSTVTLDADRVDAEDLTWSSNDESASIDSADGPLITVEGYLSYDVDHILGVAEWWETFAVQASEVARELRRQAASVCLSCDGHGVTGPEDGDCRACSGSGVIA